jgi:hypothetical protein
VNTALRLALVGAAIVVGASGGYLLHGAGTSAKKHAVADPSGSADLDELKGRIAELEQAQHRNSTVEPSTRIVQVEVPAASHHETSAARRPAPQPRVSQEEMADIIAKRKQRFDGLLHDEPRDRSWAPEYEASLRDAVQATSKADGASVVESVSCRTSICRLELSSASSEAQRAFMGNFHQNLPPMAAVHFTTATGDDGASKTTLDFVRAGYPTDPIDGPVD